MLSNLMKKTLYSAIAFLLLGLGISLQIKAGIGQSMFNAFCMLWADLFHVEIGTMINLFNLLFFLLYLIIQASLPKRKDMIQIIATMVNGFVINLFTYSVLNHIIIQSYIVKIIIFLLGLILASVSLGAILAMEVIRFPLEALCIVLSERLNYNLTKTRMRFDIFFFASTLIVTLLTNRSLYIREGTVISFFLLSGLMGFSYHFHKKHFHNRSL